MPENKVINLEELVEEELDEEEMLMRAAAMSFDLEG